MFSDGVGVPPLLLADTDKMVGWVVEAEAELTIGGGAPLKIRTGLGLTGCVGVVGRTLAVCLPAPFFSKKFKRKPQKTNL